MKPGDVSVLRVEFGKALGSERKAILHRIAMENKELKASQTARLREWEGREKALHLKFIEDNPSKGKVLREYAAEKLQRRKVFLKFLSDEMKERKKAQAARLEALKVDQAQREKEFDAFLKKNEQPPERLWPQPGL